MRLEVGLVAAVGLVACIDHPDPPVVPDGSPQFSPVPGAPQSSSGSARPGTSPPSTPKDPKAMLEEVVYVFMDHYDGGHYMCTGTLVAKDIVVTAGHCLDESAFHNWEIVAPLAKGKPGVSASNPAWMGDDYEAVENPDIGFLRLDDPIELPAYATLTDITSRVEKGEKITALAIVRDKEDFEAPFKVVSGLSVTSTTKYAYSHGFGTPIFSKGGDSGAGLFLVENGQPTHKLIGVARQPDPARKLDHFTRIDADFLEWLDENTGQ
jgi:hypothetical protein